jgi:Ca-activated chloride channel family protein
MKIDDPNLTAFALDELDEAERQAVEARLRDDAEASAEVAQVRELSTLLRRVLATETAPPLQDEQREELLAAVAAGAEPPVRTEHVASAPAAALRSVPAVGTPAGEKIVRPPIWRRAWIPAAVAACVAVVTGVVMKNNENSSDAAGDLNFAAGSVIFEEQSAAPTPPLSDAHPQSSTAPAASESEAQRIQKAIAASPATASAAPLPASEPSLHTSRAEMKQTETSAITGDERRAVPSPAKQDEGSPVRHRPSGAAGPSASTAKTPNSASPSAGHPFLQEEGEKNAPAAPMPAIKADEARMDKPSSASRAADAAGLPKAEAISRLTPAPPSTITPPALPSRPQVTVPSPVQPTSSGRAGGRMREYTGASSPAPATSLQPTSSGTARGIATATGGWAMPGGRGGSPQRDELTVQRQTAAAQPTLRGSNTTAGTTADAGPALTTEQSREAGLNFKVRDEAEKLKAQVKDAFGVHPSDRGNTEAYDAITDNPFLPAKENPLSTFSIDVDTASYTNVRRFLTSGQRPPKGAVRIEELINYFTYTYPQPAPGEPFSVTMEVATCPWAAQHRLLRIGMKAREIPREERPVANLVFLIDVSGSMTPQTKLPLVKDSLRLLIEQLGPQDTVAIAVYAGASGTVLEPTNDKNAIRAALDRLQAGGSTNGGAGIRLAYELARRSFDKAKTNRVLLATDGDFNVGVTSQSELVDLITKEAKSGVFLTVLGFGYGNLKDSTLEKLADKGNGNYAYVDSIAEGRRVLVEQMAGTLITVAKDVKLQIEFNPAQVSAYRLIGYENRLLQKEDFNDDKKDAGEIGAGHTVTALYEVVPANVKPPSLTRVDALKYQPAPGEPAPLAADTATAPAAAQPSPELLTLKLRWKAPDADTSTLKELPLTDSGLAWEKSSPDFRWASAVASFGMLLRESPYKGAANWESTHELATEGRGEDRGGYRAEFLTLIEKAAGLAR